MMRAAHRCGASSQLNTHFDIYVYTYIPIYLHAYRSASVSIYMHLSIYLHASVYIDVWIYEFILIYIYETLNPKP